MEVCCFGSTLLSGLCAPGERAGGRGQGWLTCHLQGVGVPAGPGVQGAKVRERIKLLLCHNSTIYTENATTLRCSRPMNCQVVSKGGNSENRYINLKFIRFLSLKTEEKNP